MQYLYHKLIPHEPVSFDYSLLDKVREPDTSNLSPEHAQIIENEWPHVVWNFNYDLVSGKYKSSTKYFHKNRVKKSLSRIGYDFLLDFFDAGEYINNCNIFFQGNGTKLRNKEKTFKHIHPPIDGSNTMTFTIIAPIEINEPITETLCLNEQTIRECEYESHEDWLTSSCDLGAEGEVVKIKYPDAGNILVVNFDSSKNVHWVEGITTNKYLILIVDGYKK